jgi:quercetin dioxygenase-like cupin family protein
MKITRTGSQPTTRPPEQYFTGTVRMDAHFKGIGGATVTFEPGARTA